MNGEGISKIILRSMVNIWFLLYMVDIGRNYYLYLLILSPVYKFLNVFLVKIWPRFIDGQLIIRITVKGREGISITHNSQLQCNSPGYVSHVVNQVTG